MIRFIILYFKVNSAIRYCILLKDPNFGATLELAIRFGKTLLIREITSIEPVLFPLLRHDLIAMG